MSAQEKHMAMIPIRYVGPKDTEVEHNYGSWVEFKKNEVAMVPDYAAKMLLERHPGEYQDARHKTQLGRPITPVEPEPEKPVEEVVLPPLVHLDVMTKEQIAGYVQRNFGVELGEKAKKSEMIDKARALMGGAPRVSV